MKLLENPTHFPNAICYRLPLTFVIVREILICEVTTYPPTSWEKSLIEKIPNAVPKKFSQDFHVQYLLSVNAQKAASQDALWSM